MSVRVMVVDEYAVVRAGISYLLDAEEDIETVGQVKTLDEALESAPALGADVVLLEVGLHGGAQWTDGIAALRQAAPAVKVLAISALDDPRCVQAAFAAGATGYILKDTAASRLVDAVRGVAGGERYLDPSLGARLAVAEREAASDPLSAAERQVVRLLALGHTCSSIADMVGRSPRTVEVYRARVMRKLGLQTRAALVHYALEHGLLDETSECCPDGSAECGHDRPDAGRSRSNGSL